MSRFYSNNERYITKSVTWNIRNQSSWIYKSPIFYLNKQQCSLTVNITSNGYNYQYNLNTVDLNFTNSYTDFHYKKFIVILYIANNPLDLMFNLSPSTTSTKTFSTNGSRVVTESALGGTTCSITAMIFYQQLEDPKIESFFNDMNSLLKSEIYSDFQIKAGDKIFNVHKAIIAARSRVLKKMTENDMSEKKLGRLELQADPIVVQELIDYLYTSKLKVTVVPTELFKLAHFLELEELQMYCKKHLLNNIHLKNIINILELTSYNDYDLKDLHDAAIKFVNKNENSLITDLEFEQFLCNNIKLETITFILRISYKHNLENCLNKAIEYIIIHYKKVFNNTEFEAYLKSQPALCFEILKYNLDFFNTPEN